jgi:hypothetical protein
MRDRLRMNKKERQGKSILNQRLQGLICYRHAIKRLLKLTFALALGLALGRAD